MPRKESCVWASDPSREMETRLMPAFLMRSATSFVTRVPLVASAVRRPRPVAYSASSKMSARYSGSPPLSTRMGLPKSAICEMMSSAFFVGRSSGDINSVAVARQWMHRRLQPLVTSQKTSRGVYSFFAACALPLPSVIACFPPPLLRITAPRYVSTIGFYGFGERCVLSQRPVTCVTRGGLRAGRGRTKRLQLVQPVQRRDFEGFRQRRIVEYGVAEILDGSSQRKHCLPDVDDLSGAIADDVHSQQLQACRIEDQLQKSLIVSQHLRFDQFGITGNADLVRDLVTRELLFGRANHRNFRNCVNAVGNQVRRDIAGHAENVATGKPSLLHGRAGQGRKADHIAGGINMRYRGAEVFIDHQLPASVRHQTNRLQIE